MRSKLLPWWFKEQSDYSNGYVWIDQTGSTYDSERSNLEQLFGSYSLAENGLGQLAQLKKEHRSFMRGKQNLGGFYEDKQVLADVEIISIYNDVKRNYNFRLNVSILDKEDNQVNEFEVSIPHDSEYQWLTIQDVQIVGKQLKVLTQNAKQNARKLLDRESDGISYLFHRCCGREDR